MHMAWRCAVRATTSSVISTANVTEHAIMKPTRTQFIFGILFLVVGVFSLVRHLFFEGDDLSNPAVLYEHVPMFISAVVAIVGGVLLVMANRCGRWFVLVWLAVHAVIGMMHTWDKGAIHVAMLAIGWYFLFWRGRAGSPNSSE